MCVVMLVMSLQHLGHGSCKLAEVGDTQHTARYLSANNE